MQHVGRGIGKLRPRLTPPELIAIIQETAERSSDGRRILIHPARALAVAQARAK